MCHIALVLPLLALPVFWIWPLAVSIPVYAVVAIVSALVYWYAVLAMRRPIETGPEGMVGTHGEVVGESEGRLVVRIGSELWTARSSDDIRVGDRVVVLAVKRLMIIVKALDPSAASSHQIPASPSSGHASSA